MLAHSRDHGVVVAEDTERELGTERLRLRGPVAGDLSAVQRIHRDPAAVVPKPLTAR